MPWSHPKPNRLLSFDGSHCTSGNLLRCYPTELTRTTPIRLRRIFCHPQASLQHVLSNYVEHHHSERNHQGKGNVILFPKPADRIGESSGEILKRERLGGLLKFYHREAV